ncbi:MAG: penicillin-binding protein [Athalassotoga sp.]|uniref:penicillin-binding protein n=1 Tax=Athalassotoga sp. TaxID=2022597 RepID=UPI003CFE8EBD
MSIFLVIISIYVIRSFVIASDFKRVRIPKIEVAIPASYGEILGSDGQPIMQNALEYNVYIDVGYAKTLSEIYGWKYPDRVIEAVKYFGLDPDSPVISKIISDQKGGIEVGNVKAQKIKNLPDGISKFLNIQRVYVETRVASSLSIIAKAISQEYIRYISPKKDGTLFYDSLGPYNVVSKIKSILEPVNGDTIITTINPSIQAFAQQMIDNDVKENDARGGEVIVTDPQNNDILAMASTWQYDAPIMNLFQPASTMKPLIFCEALQEGVVNPNTKFNGPYYIPDPKIPLVIRDAEPHPWPVSLKDALVYSSDVAEMKIATRLINKIGPKAYYDWFSKFGFGRKTGIDLPNETSGILPPPSKWYGIGGQEMAIGQSIAVTGIQMITALNAVANGGYWIRPHVVNEIISPSGSIVYRYHPFVRKIFESRITKIVRKFMVGVVEKGTGIPAQISGVSVGGKTGTAEKPENGKVSIKGPWFSLFYGFFPANDPEYSIYVMVDQPSKGLYYGEDVAAPLIHSIGTYILDLNKGDKNTTYGLLSYKMPDLEGLPLNQALSILEKLSISPNNISFSGNGIVISQFPSPNTPLSKVKNIILKLSTNS